jgi:hypothetical protein
MPFCKHRLDCDSFNPGKVQCHDPIEYKCFYTDLADCDFMCESCGHIGDEDQYCPECSANMISLC